MAELQFYAARGDVADVLAFVFERGWYVYEHYSEPNRELQRFASSEQVLSAYDAVLAGKDDAHRRTFLLQLWAPQTRGEPIVDRFDLHLRRGQPPAHRYELKGWGVMQLQIAGAGAAIVGVSRFAHNSEKRARAREDAYAESLGFVAEWDWGELQRVSRKFRYHLSTRLAVRKRRNGIVRPVLREADALTRRGYDLALN